MPGFSVMTRKNKKRKIDGVFYYTRKETAAAPSWIGEGEGEKKDREKRLIPSSDFPDKGRIWGALSQGLSPGELGRTSPVSREVNDRKKRRGSGGHKKGYQTICTSLFHRNMESP